MLRILVPFAALRRPLRPTLELCTVSAYVVVLRADKPYSSEHKGLLLSFHTKNVSLFCAVGRFANEWEDAMDELAIAFAEGGAVQPVTTTSHVDEPIEDVLNMDLDRALRQVEGTGDFLVAAALRQTTQDIALAR